ncbi:DUF4878 domain-containing protein [Bacillus tuaregi]|uniref:DUF4878 domain-containing protein n=1 Tax=Bacillus tuaregi TaxID=1816695 RepID=UPI0008F87794|nr:DUF4878 domain-containing protein [Bacillus tuaregi]
MGNYNENFSKRICRPVIVLLFILVVNSFSNFSSVNAETKEDVLNTVVNYLKAQKDCNVEDMITYSERAHQISNVKEFYKMMCKKLPLQEAKITNISIINETTALVSIEATHKDRIFIGTSPVIKKEGKWKIIRGIPGSEYVEYSSKTNRDDTEDEVKRSIEEYSKAIKSGDINEIKKYIAISSDKKKNRLEQHFKAISKEPIPQVTPLGIKVISDTFAIAQIQTSNEHFSLTQNYAVCQEEGQWKVVFGHTLTNSAIPKNDKSVEVK